MNGNTERAYELERLDAVSKIEYDYWRGRAEKAEMELASLCDAINTEARECGALEADKPTRDEMRIAVQQIVDKLRSNERKAKAGLAQARENMKGVWDYVMKHFPWAPSNDMTWADEVITGIDMARERIDELKKGLLPPKVIEKLANFVLIHGDLDKDGEMLSTIVLKQHAGYVRQLLNDEAGDDV